MRVAVYSLTRDRLEYTKYCFESLAAKAGYPYDHFVIDNGSEDGTAVWLKDNSKFFKHLILSDSNLGISAGSNLLLQNIVQRNVYDLVVKFDNDCEVVSENILGQMVEIFSEVGRFSPRYALSPRVAGIINQPYRVRFTQLAGRRVGLTGVIGGLFCVIPISVAVHYKYPESLPLAWGQDDHFCKWFKSQGGEVGYVEGLIVNHYETTDGQCRRYPEYFKRKWKEEGRSETNEALEK